jgi:hypothetical protein
MGLALLGALALAACAPQHASRTSPDALGLAAGIAPDEEQVCAAPRSGATVSAACVREMQVAQTAGAAGSGDAPKPERAAQGDTLKTASEVAHLLGEFGQASGGLGEAVLGWRRALGPMP